MEAEVRADAVVPEHFRITQRVIGGMYARLILLALECVDPLREGAWTELSSRSYERATDDATNLRRDRNELRLLSEEASRFLREHPLYASDVKRFLRSPQGANATADVQFSHHLPTLPELRALEVAPRLFESPLESTPGLLDAADYPQLGAITPPASALEVRFASDLTTAAPETDFLAELAASDPSSAVTAAPVASNPAPKALASAFEEDPMLAELSSILDSIAQR